MQSLQSTIYKNALQFGKSLETLSSSLSQHAIKKIGDEFIYYLQDLLLFLESGKAGNGIVPAGKELQAFIAAVLSVEEFEQRISATDRSDILCTLERFLRDQYTLLENRKKIVVLTINAGNGHKSAAYALEQGFKRQYGYDYLVSVQDIQVDLNTLYESSVKFTPQVYKWVFESTDSSEGMAILHGIGYPLFAKKLDKILETEKPDIMVSTYCFPGINTWLEKTLRAHKPYIPFVAVVTDSITVHHMWFADEIDYYIVTNADTKSLMVSKGIPEKKIQVLGFPVHPAFYEPLDKKSCMDELGFSEKRPTFLVSIGTAASSKEVSFLSKFKEDLGDKANIIVATGRNEHIYKTLIKKDLGAGVKVLGWTNQMYKYLQLADVIVTKAGGATVMECVALKKPMIITKVLPGQEEGNALLVEKYGLGEVVRKNDDLLQAITVFVSEKDRIEATKRNFSPIWHDKATYKIVDFLITLL